MKRGKWWCKTPKDLLTELAREQPFYSLCDSVRRKPGQTILNLTEAERELLKDLKSGDLEKVRPFQIMFGDFTPPPRYR